MRLSHFTVKIHYTGKFLDCRVNNLSLQWNFLRILQRLLLNGILRAFSRVSLIHRGRTDCHNAGRKHRCLKCEFKPKISKQPTRALIRYKAISLICAFILREFHWQRHVFFPHCLRVGFKTKQEPPRYASFVPLNFHSTREKKERFKRNRNFMYTRAAVSEKLLVEWQARALEIFQ